MSGTMTVKELITELLDYDMDLSVYIGLGPDAKPDSEAEIMKVGEYRILGHYQSNIYLIPTGHLVNANAGEQQ